MNSAAIIDSPTVRETVKLPPMPKESAASTIHPPVDMARGFLEGPHLRFETEGGFEQALRQGFFLLKTPGGYSDTPGDKFVSHFFETPQGDALDSYRGFRDVEIPGDYQGYFDRPNDQWENFYIERSNWSKLPADVADMGQEMCAIGVRVLRSVLQQIGIPEEYWAQLTSGLSDFQGHQMLGFNHFRADKKMRGSKFHRDSGWVTMLRTTSPGLLAYIDETLHSVNPEQGYFIVNFGSSVEILTEHMPTPVRASVHGVVQTERSGDDQQDRVSYVSFLDSALDGTIYRWEPDGPLALQSVLEFAMQEVERTYDDDNEKL